ncbi:MAG: hypothetical protein E2O39_05475 [Planctomycetota bacterium]|nr:MAG: hypothetical protein E2O39_05475 [Planctomycetota bacterium]
MAPSRHTPPVACALVLLSLMPAAWGQAGGYVEVFMEGTLALEAGELAVARERFSACLARGASNPIVAFHLACVEARMGAGEAALGHLEAAVGFGYVDAEVALTDPDLESLHANPRFESVVRRMRERRTLARSGAHAAEIDRVWPDPRRAISPDGLRSVTLNGLVLDELSGAVLASLGGPVLRSEPVFAPDGSVIVTTHPGGVLRVWDARERRTYPLLHELDGLPDSWAWLSFDASGTRLLYSATALGATERKARILRLPAGVWEQRLQQPANAFSVLAPDGRTALLGGHVESHSMFPEYKRKETLFHLVDLDTGAAIASGHTRGWPASTGSFSSDGRHALAYSSSWSGSAALIVFDVEARATVGVIERTADISAGAVFARDPAHLLTAGRGGRLVRRSLPSLEAVSSWQAHAGDVLALRASADGELAFTWGEDGFVRCWSSATEGMLWERELGAQPREPIRFMPMRVDGGRLVIPRANGFFVLDAKTGAREDARQSAVRVSGRPAVDSQETVVAVPCSDGTVRVVELESGAERARLETGIGPLGRIEFGPHGQRLAGIGRGGVWLFDASSGALVAEFPAQASSDGSWPALAFRPDGGTVATWNTQRRSALWDASSGAHVAWLDGAEGAVRRAAWSPDGALLATAEWSCARASCPDGTVTLRTGDTGRPTGVVLPHPLGVTGIAFTADGDRLATACADGFARVWDPSDGALLQTFAHDDIWGLAAVRSVQVSSDGAWLVTTTGTLGQVWIWDLATGVLQWRVANGGGPSAIHALLSDDGRRVYITGDYLIGGIWDVRTGVCQATLVDAIADDFVAAGDFQRLIATGAGALQILDGTTLDLNYAWVPYGSAEGSAGYLAHAPSNHFRGTADAARQFRMQVDGAAYPLDTFAAVLLDPKRVRAAARGIPVFPARLPEPPTLELVAPLTRVVEGHGAVTIEALAADSLALAGLAFEVERDGHALDASLRRAATTVTETSRSARLTLTIPWLGDPSETTIRICAVARSGVLSLPAVVTIRWRP